MAASSRVYVMGHLELRVLVLISVWEMTWIHCDEVDCTLNSVLSPTVLTVFTPEQSNAVTWILKGNEFDTVGVKSLVRHCTQKYVHDLTVKVSNLNVTDVPDYVRVKYDPGVVAPHVDEVESTNLQLSN